MQNLRFQAFVGALLLVDVGVGAEPAQNLALRIAIGKGPRQMPAIGAVAEPPQASLQLEGLTGRNPAPGGKHPFRQILRVYAIEREKFQTLTPARVTAKRAVARRFISRSTPWASTVTWPKGARL